MELVCGGPHLDEGNSKTIEIFVSAGKSNFLRARKIHQVLLFGVVDRQITTIPLAGVMTLISKSRISVLSAALGFRRDEGKQRAWNG